MLYTIFKLKENAYKVNEYACYEKEKGNSLPAMWDGLFEEVAVIRADNLEEVFDVGNQNPEKVFHKGHRKLYTINVGDLIHDIIDNQQEQIFKLKRENVKLKDIIKACKDALITDNYKLMSLLEKEKIL